MCENLLTTFVIVNLLTVISKGNRQSPGWEGPTYVGIFPVLTGQQACPACPEAHVCQNCTVCNACWSTVPQNQSLASKTLHKGLL